MFEIIEDSYGIPGGRVGTDVKVEEEEEMVEMPVRLPPEKKEKVTTKEWLKKNKYYVAGGAGVLFVGYLLLKK